ncbi:glutathione hydrolase 6 isoform b [Homo sapiens]|uniref:Isoform 2 of Glutathione hydrolase 6 n=1 Tax=Homo sapiens TaxID=9606 RepID=Q6P531-2|nr:glutathione hydrolase 6 isoform b [Homo sapiens]XP_047291292.1 glutathione hydrolase 6 isoform X4 [Homo sapiens]KAI2580688.1 gamma-glutamyltransferase 6 [Homo sapiens]|eukprot:NP_699169.2 glutathione hydrolase 6 isoform b [Homo sapiens]
MERAEEPVVYQKLLPWEPSLESEEEVEEEETSEALVLNPRRHQDSSRNKAGGLPGTWARVVAALLLLAVGCSLAVRQLQNQGRSTGSLGSVAPPPGGHSHGPGVYHHGAIISPAGAMFWGLFHDSSSGNSTALTSGPAQTLAPGLGLPAALPTLHLLHARFGRLPWPRLLVGPTTLAQEGFLVDTPLARALVARGTEGLCPLLCHADGTPLGAGARATNPQLAAVLRSAALAPTSDLAGDALLSLLAGDLGVEVPSAVPRPTLEPAEQLPVPQGILFTTPSPSAGPELLALLEAALRSGAPIPDPCPPFLQTAVSPESSALAAVDSSGSVLLLTSSLNCSFGSAHLSPSTGVLLSNLVAKSTTSAWACPLILRGSLDDTEADVLGLVASGTPDVARAMTHTLLRHLAARPPTQAQHQHQGQQEPTEHPSTCGQGTLLQVAAHTEHAHVSSVPHACCPFQGF